MVPSWVSGPSSSPSTWVLVAYASTPSLRWTATPNTGVETGRAYCRNIRATAPARLQANSRRFARASSPTPDQPDLLAFLQARLTGTLTMLGC